MKIPLLVKITPVIISLQFGLLISCKSTKDIHLTQCTKNKKVLASFNQGREDAQEDIENGIYKIKRWGMPPYYGYQKLLKEKYNIEIEMVSGYFFSLNELRYIEGYNHAMRTFIIETYGESFLPRVSEEALKEYPVISNQDKEFIYSDPPRLPRPAPDPAYPE